MRRRDVLALSLACVGGLRSSVLHAQSPVEEDLLHIRIDPASFARLAIWDEREVEWRRSRPEENPADRPILVVHFWADWCQPCKEEFPLLREVDERITRAHPGKVRFVYLAEIPNSPAMEKFLRENRSTAPRGPHYQDTAELMIRMLRPLLSKNHITYPCTLLLDERRIVRQVFVNSLRGRTLVLTRSIGRLVEQIRPC